MRLTLRTLLAYLDDVLEPAQAREIGEKIQESSLATSLVSRIQDVVRRRRIEAPAVSGPGSKPDPNIVAEYLDNALAPKYVAEMEQVCLESDQHLAEVAACHQVLTLVQVKPVTVPRELREHMYSLGAVAPAEGEMGGNGKAHHTPRVVGVGAADVTRDVNPRSGEQDLLEHPQARTGRSSWKRALPYIVGAVVLLGWAYSMITDNAFKDHFVAHHPPNAAAVERPARPNDVPPDVRDDVDAAGVSEPSADDGEVAVPDVVLIPNADEPIDVELHDDGQLAGSVPPAPLPLDEPVDEAATVADATPSAEIVASETEISPVTEEPVLEQNALAKADTPAPEPGAETITPVPEQAELAAPQHRAFEVQYVNSEGVLLQRDKSTDQWNVLPRRSLIFPREEVASPQPFDARFTVSDRQQVCEFILRGGTRVRLLDPTAETGLGLEIDRGRVVLSRPEDSESAASGKPVVFRLKVRADEWLCELVEPNTVLGVEVIPAAPTKVGDIESGMKYSGGISLSSGSAKLTNLATQQAVELHPQLPSYTFTGDAQAPLAEAEPTIGGSDWLQSGGASTRLARQYATRYEREFLPEQPVVASVRPVVKSPQPRMSELATQTLALIGNVSGMVDALSADHQESRLAAIEGLRVWLPRDPANVDELKARLENRFREDAAAAIERMLWGYTEDDARSNFVSQELVNWLAHDEIAVRELAAYHVQRLTNRDHGYRADRRPDEREAVIKRWRQQLEKSGALLSQ